MRLVKLILSNNDCERFKKFVEEDTNITKRIYREKRLDHLLKGKTDPYLFIEFFTISRVDKMPIIKVGNDYEEHLYEESFENIIKGVIDFEFNDTFEAQLVNIF